MRVYSVTNLAESKFYNIIKLNKKMYQYLLLDYFKNLTLLIKQFTYLSYKTGFARLLLKNLQNSWTKS